MTIAIDFDGTIVEHRYPLIGPERIFATETLRRLIADGHRLVLWTVRQGQLLDEAVEWCRERGVTFYAVNGEYPEENLSATPFATRKPKVDIFIDDRNVGGLPDWGTIYRIITEGLTYEEIMRERASEPQGLDAYEPPRRWWQFW